MRKEGRWGEVEKKGRKEGALYYIFLVAFLLHPQCCVVEVFCYRTYYTKCWNPWIIISCPGSLWPMIPPIFLSMTSHRVVFLVIQLKKVFWWLVKDYCDVSIVNSGIFLVGIFQFCPLCKQIIFRYLKELVFICYCQMFSISVTRVFFPCILQITLILSHNRDENEYVKQIKYASSLYCKSFLFWLYI